MTVTAPTITRPLDDIVARLSPGFDVPTPNWFATVMGTGCLAVCAAAVLPASPAQRALGTTAWALACCLLVIVTVVTAISWHRRPHAARAVFRHPVMAHFLGAAPMGVLTVGTSTLLFGHAVLGAAAIPVAVALWCVGTALGLAGFAWITAVVPPWSVTDCPVPVAERRNASIVAASTRSATDFGRPTAGRLMAIVPPMVSAAGGAQLALHVPSLRTPLLAASYAQFTLVIAGAAPIIVAVAAEVFRNGPGPADRLPTLWIVLGPLGQSATAALLLGESSGDRLYEGYATAALLAAAVWSVVAGRHIARAIRRGLPFSMTWWSFTFPLGTCVTGVAGLARHTGSAWLAGLAAALFAALVAAWVVVAVRTVRRVAGR